MEVWYHSTEWTPFTIGVDPDKGLNILRKGVFFDKFVKQHSNLDLVSGEFQWGVSMNDNNSPLLGHGGGMHCTDCHS